MKKIGWFFLSWCLVVGAPEAADIVSTGDWTEMIDASDLTAGAGSDLISQYTSATSSTTLTISNTSGSSWRVLARRSDTIWNNGFTLWAKRTSDGAGSGSISGGTVYVELTTLDVEICSGTGDRSNIGLQFKLTGMSKDVSPNTYNSTVIFTATQ